MADLIKRAENNIKRTVKWLYGSIEVRFVLCAILTVIFGEVLNSGVGGLGYPFRHPLAFLLAVSVLTTTYLFTLLSPCRLGTFIVIEGFWLGFAIANKIMLGYRVNPLSSADFKILIYVFSIIDVYLSLFQIIAICVAIAAAVALAVFMMIRLPKVKPRYKSTLLKIAVMAVVTFLVGSASVGAYLKDMRRMNLPEAYDEYGFTYSFCMSWVDRGISRPSDYSQGNINSLIGNETDKPTGGSPSHVHDGDGVNVILVQLESFIDPRTIVGLDTSEDAIPCFRALKESFPTGTLTVPTAGAGTVNTEFEVLCGIPVSVFGLGEYPYETVAMEQPCESLAYYFSGAGYTTHAIHNHTGTFYNRHTVMQNLGFDTFTPVEFMSDIRKNSLGWAKDKPLTDEIMGALGSTEGLDMIYAISVQPHGKYPTEVTDYGKIKASGAYDTGILAAMEYYLNQLRETDAFVGALTEAAAAFEEDVIIVFFGDHQPSLELTRDNVAGGSLYTTEYVVWSNFDLEAEGGDLASYELGTYVLDLLGMDGGVISTLNREHGDSDSYGDYASSLAYDIFLGEKYAYGGTFPYKTKSIVYGWDTVTAEGAYLKNEVLYVIGDGFTEASTVFIGGRRRDTVYINENMIICDNISAAEVVTVAQVAESGFVFNEIPCPVIPEPE